MNYQRDLDWQAGIVRILTSNGESAGTGFIVTPDGLIATCAHVISDAVAESDGIVQLVFQATKEKGTAKVEPNYLRSPEAEDIALLRLDGLLPEKVLPLPLGSSSKTEGQIAHTFGFPAAKSIDGLLGECKVIGFISEGYFSVLQLSSNQISKGFSGAPIWHDGRRAVIGMVTSIVGMRETKIANQLVRFPFDPGGRQLETAFAIPVETMQTVCPLLRISEICPYLGLDAFTENHAKFFFGRELVVDRLVNRLKQDIRFLAVLGPSGSGKSSVVQAGLIPRLRQGMVGDSDHWGLIVTRPADDPFKQLATQGLSVVPHNLTESARGWLNQHPAQTRLVLIIDQFEELLTTCSEAVRQDFVRQLAQLLGAPLLITVMIVMRDDFYDQFVQDETLEEWLYRSQGPINVPKTLKWAEVAAIVQQPAEVVGLRFEDGLADIIVKDSLEVTTYVTDEGSSARSTILPLLEFTLTQLWERRQDGTLTRKAYKDIAGVTGGLTQWADRVFYGIEDEERRRKTRRVFTDLIFIGDETQGIPDSRQQRSLEALSRNAAQMEEIHLLVDYLASNRLLVTTQETQSKQVMVEIIHDALLWEWGLLKQWLQEDRAFLAWHQELEKRVRAWIATNPDERLKRDEHKLFGGSDLTEATKWLEIRPADLSQDELDFIQASREHQAREEGLRKRYTRRVILVGLAGVGLSAVVGGTTWRILSQAANQSGVLPHPSPIATPPTQKTPRLVFRGHTLPVNAASWSPDGTRIVSGSDDTNKLKRVLVWSASTGKTLIAYTGHTDEVKTVVWSPDGKRIASGGDDRTVQIWDASTGETLLICQGHSDEVRSLAWSPDNKYLASASWDSTVRIWDVATGETRRIYTGHNGYQAWAVAWSPNGKYIASGSSDATVQVWEPLHITYDSLSGEQDIFAYHGHSDTVYTVAWSSDSKRIASGSRDTTAQVWDALTGSNPQIYSAHSSSVFAVAWSPSSIGIVSASLDHTVQVWNVASGNILRIYNGHSNWVNDAAWSPNGKYIVSASDDTTVMVWQAP